MKANVDIPKGFTQYLVQRGINNPTMITKIFRSWFEISFCTMDKRDYEDSIILNELIGNHITDQENALFV